SAVLVLISVIGLCGWKPDARADWRPSIDFAPGAASIFAINDRGEALAAWGVGDAGVRASARPPSGPFGAPVKISDKGFPFAAAVGESGDRALAWFESTPKTQIGLRTWEADGQLGAAQSFPIDVRPGDQKAGIVV